MTSLSLCIIVFFTQSSLLIEGLFEGDKCYTTNGGVEGICKKIGECSSAIHHFKSGLRPTTCSFIGLQPVVCCAEDGPGREQEPPGRPVKPKEPVRGGKPGTTLSPQEKAKQKCEEYVNISSVAIKSSGEEITSPCELVVAVVVGGVKTYLGEFPHMALIGFNEENPQWHCGGSLISERFVLSAAHCSHPSGLGPALWVKLGELDTSSDDDGAKPQIIRIIERIDHPDYRSDSQYNDISLFKLERNIEISAFIRPVCLATDASVPYSAVATGWGHLGFGGPTTDILMKVTLGIINKEECSAEYERSPSKLAPQGILDSLICAGEFEKDTCQDDSGGPLQKLITDPYCTYEIIGVTSSGRLCGGGFPGLYTRISHFVPWIVQTVWPDE